MVLKYRAISIILRIIGSDRTILESVLKISGVLVFENWTINNNNYFSKLKLNKEVQVFQDTCIAQYITLASYILVKLPFHEIFQTTFQPQFLSPFQYLVLVKQVFILV